MVIEIEKMRQKGRKGETGAKMERWEGERE